MRPLLLILLLATAASCKKTSDRMLEKETECMVGVWTIASLRHVVTDTLGRTLSDSTTADAGTIEFREAADEGEPFQRVLFENGRGATELTGYFRGVGATDATVNGGVALYWDADPAAKRINIWGIGPSSSYHRFVNVEYDGAGKNERVMWYTLPIGTSSATSVKRDTYYYTLRK